MSYVYCGYCGNRGHNKLGCPTRKKIAREEPNSYVARQIEYERENRRRAVERRVCSYCQEAGHNRRGCNTRKTDIIKISQCQAKFVSDFSSRCIDLGLTPGALIAMGSEERKTILYVEDFIWPSLTFILRDATLDYHGRVPWKISEKNVLRARIVSDQVLSTGAALDYAAPSRPPGERVNIQLSTLSSLFTNVFLQAIDGRQHNGTDALQLEILSPIFEDNLKPPSEPTGVGSELSYMFNLESPAPNYKHSSSRLDMYNTLWEKVYPSEHAKAAAELEAQRDALASRHSDGSI